MHDLALGRYRLLEQLGRGGMADVWLATDQTSGRRVAVKRLHPSLAADPAAAARFRREAEAGTAVDHPNAVHVLDAGPDVLVMEYVAGESLAARVRRGPVDPQAVTRIGATLSSGLAAVHAAGFVHGDVTPGNVLLDPSGAAHLADFGAAQRIAPENSSTTRGELVGTRPYVAPEVMSGGQATVASDVWSMGVALVEALTGQRPVPDSGGEHGTTPSLVSLSAGSGALAPLLSEMLATDPARRPAAATVSSVLAPSPEAVTEVLTSAPKAYAEPPIASRGLPVGLAFPAPPRRGTATPRLGVRQAVVAATGVLVAAGIVLAAAGPADPASSGTRQNASAASPTPQPTSTRSATPPPAIAGAHPATHGQGHAAGGHGRHHGHGDG